MTSKKIILFLYYFIFTSISFFFAPYLKTKGLDPVKIGFLTTQGLSITIIFYFILSYLSDKIKSIKLIIFPNLILTAIIFFFLIVSTNEFYLSLSYLLSYACFLSIVPLLDSFILQGTSKNKYNKIRSSGSLGAAISYFLNVFFLEKSRFTYDFLIRLNMIFLLIILILLINQKETKSSIGSPSQKQPTLKNRFFLFKKSIIYILNNYQILFIFLIAFLTYGTLKADDPYQYYYYTEITLLTPFIVSLCGAIAIFFESFFMKIYNYFSKFKITYLLLIATGNLLIIDFVKANLYSIKFLIILAYIMQGLFLGIFIPVAILTLDKYSEKSLKTTILGLYQIMISLGGIVIGFATNFILKQNYYLPNMYILHAILILIAFILILIFNLKQKNNL